MTLLPACTIVVTNSAVVLQNDALKLTRGGVGSHRSSASRSSFLLAASLGAARSLARCWTDDRSAMSDLSEADLKARRPVWNALSRLLVDVMLDGPDGKKIAGILAASPYDVKDLEKILLWEVYPACGTLSGWAWGPLRAVDPTVLERRILRPSLLMRMVTVTLGRVAIAVSYSWHEVKRQIRLDLGALQQ